MKKIGKAILFFLFFAMIIYGASDLFVMSRKYVVSEKAYDSIADQYVAAVTVPTEEAAAADPTEPKEFAPIQVDFETLKQEYKDIIGWIYSEDTVINYPVVQAADNDFYVHRLPDGKANEGGSIFMDYRNAPDLSDWNSILYGHNMNNDSMFGTLSDYRKQEYADEHSVLYFLTPETDYKIELIGGYTTFSTSDSYRIAQDLTERDALVALAEEHTEFEPEFQAEPEDRLITLSTCTYEYDHARFILVGRLKALDRPEVN